VKIIKSRLKNVAYSKDQEIEKFMI